MFPVVDIINNRAQNKVFLGSSGAHAFFHDGRCSLFPAGKTSFVQDPGENGLSRGQTGRRILDFGFLFS